MLYNISITFNNQIAMSRASYARARRAKEEDPKPSAVRTAGEAVAKTVYKKAKPAVDAVKGVAVAGIKGYLKGTQKLADKVSKVLPEDLAKPRYSNRTIRRRVR